MKQLHVIGLFLLLLGVGCQGVSMIRLPSKNFRMRNPEEALETWKGKSAHEMMRIYGPPDTLIKLLDSTEKVARYVSTSTNYEYQGGYAVRWYGNERVSRSRWSDSLAVIDFFIDSSNTITHARSEGNVRLYWYPSNEKVSTTPSGLSYVDYVVGSGTIPKRGDLVTVHFTGMLTDSSIFDSSILPEFDQPQPLMFTLGAKEVILGMEEAISTMRVGGKRKVVVPPHLAYGDQGSGEHIGPNATLVFYLDLIEAR